MAKIHNSARHLIAPVRTAILSKTYAEREKRQHEFRQKKAEDTLDLHLFPINPKTGKRELDPKITQELRKLYEDILNDPKIQKRNPIPKETQQKLIFYLRFTSLSFGDISKIVKLGADTVGRYNSKTNLRSVEEVEKIKKQSEIRKRAKTPEFFFSEKEKIKILQVYKNLIYAKVSRKLGRLIYTQKAHNERLMNFIFDHLSKQLDIYNPEKGMSIASYISTRADYAVRTYVSRETRKTKQMLKKNTSTKKQIRI
ncbi:MAG: hypothetical protein Q7K42_06505 [Candidatus Diapherotrites archaeon]|nr:hypothetical protein [Candidatus Diapherotrites archaeon]